MGSNYEDTAVDSIDFGSLSDEDLKNIAENDTRTTAQDKAKAEINRRESDSGDEGDGSESDDSSDTPEPPALQAGTGRTITDPSADDLDNVDPGDKLVSLQPADPKERAERNGLNTEGINTDPDAGQAQLQAYANAVEESGTIPPTGGPPDDSHTVSEVVKREVAQKEELFESQREALGK